MVLRHLVVMDLGVNHRGVQTRMTQDPLDGWHPAADQVPALLSSIEYRV
jgi:hypothetical protein